MNNHHPAMNSSRERPAWSTSGYLMLLVFIALLFLLILRVGTFNGDDGQVGSFLSGVFLLPIALIVIAKGFYMIQPNQAAAITLFGSYRGTDRMPGLRWV